MIRNSHHLSAALLATLLACGDNENNSDSNADDPGVSEGDATPEGPGHDEGTVDEDGTGADSPADDDDDDDDDDSANDSDEGFDPCPDSVTSGPGARLMRRLTTPEFEASIRQVFNLEASSWPGPSIPPDAAAHNGFTNNASQLEITESYVERLQETAMTIAELVVDPGRMAELIPCSQNAADETCANAYLDTVGRRLYRRDLSEDERAAYLELWQPATEKEGFTGWLRWATVALIASPYHIQRLELGSSISEGHFELSGYELATALSFTYSGHPPNDALLDLAAQGELADPKRREAVARAMIYDESGEFRPEYLRQMSTFGRQYLGLAAIPNLVKDGQKHPGFTPEVQAAMVEEAERNLTHSLLDRGDSARDWLLRRKTFVNAQLAEYYGYGTVQGDGFEEVERPQGYGRGPLGMGGLLAATANSEASSPTKRGIFVRLKLLCDVLKQPDEVNPLPDAKEYPTTRERYEHHATEPRCNACHIKMDPIGFAFEHFDAAGRFRADENGHTIDDSGTIIGTSRGAVDVAGLDDLSETLAELPETGYCMAAYLASYSFGIDHHEARCVAEDAARNFVDDGGSIIDLHLALARSLHFAERNE